MPEDLRTLITASFDADVAESWSKFTVSEAEKLVLRDAALKVLGLFPGRMAGQCALMSAAYSSVLERLGAQPGYVVAGSLYLGDKRIFGENKKFDGRELFSKSNLDWNGHTWIVHGDYLADVSVFRTADAGTQRLLSKYIEKEYGRGRGFCAWPIAGMDPNGLRYVPQYVLTQDQVDALMRGALAMIEQFNVQQGKK
ncbi:hypothetical protein [Bradyrhizobium sp. BWC-3-1]|uniref:hypothetical protein n=1 Tax=Bradyrhizobium sp. BWC-3-1 TaxID=3080012 RepID=UPI00293EC94D|nr:hypothetical protein [Bradyrhizobium sp. BWC-3-1]WOH59931.1 hypothetical protein RX329_07350 [Bradyrhizobium sp. BWC-3-1]